MSRFSWLTAAATAAALTAAAALPAAGSAHPHHGHPHGGSPDQIRHVLLISVDGLHQTDLQWWVRHHPDSELAALTQGGAEYTHAQTPIPSDSFPGMVGQVTGGDPAVTGVYYDAEYSHSVLPAGSSCPSNAPTGAPVTFDESIDRDSSSLDAGQGLSGLPDSILSMTGNPTSLIDPSQLPVDPQTCRPIYPNQYLKVNTVFNVLHDAGLRTAWSDKHPAYQILDGPEGNGIDDLFTPEINSDALGYPAGNDWTTDNAATMQYDSYKVKAVLNEIDGEDHSGTQKVGVPAILGMNFQTVSTAQKLPSSDGLTGGYQPGTDVPGPLLTRALGYVDRQLATMVSELRSQGLTGSTAIIVSAKHGQSPEDPNDLTRIDDGPIIDGLNAAWQQAHPGAGDLVAAATDDDAIMMWLTDRSSAAATFASNWLWSHSATGNTVAGGSRTLAHSGLRAVYSGAAAARYFHVPVSDPRHPDVWGVVQHGVVYTGSKKKIAEHGGADPEDRDVPLVLYAPGAVHPGANGAHLETTSIAPTILRLLGLDPDALQAVKIEGTPVLPGVR